MIRTTHILVALLLASSCGRRNFNDDAAVDSLQAVDAPACVAPTTGCTSPKVYECGGSCYVVCSNTAIRAAGAATCESWGGCLSRIDNLAANNCVASQVADQTWIGALQDNNTGGPDPSQGWRWCDGELITFSRWGTGNPDDNEGVETGEQQCAVIDLAADWIDLPCSELRRFSCSRPL